MWNREFQLRWDLTKNLHMNFQSATNAEIEEPYTPINKNLYPDHYEAWKDSVKQSLRHFGTPLSYNQSFQASYQLPLNLIPIFDWINSNASYNSTYSWQRGTQLEDSTDLGNTIINNRTFTIDGTLNLVKLYNHIPFLKKTNERFDKDNRAGRRRDVNGLRAQMNNKAPRNNKGQNSSKEDQKAEEQKGNLPKNKNTFEKEIILRPDTTITVKHNKKSRRLIVMADRKSVV